MTIDDVSEVLMSTDKFRELYQSIQECYQAIDKCWDKVRRVDTLLGTAIKDSIKTRKLQDDSLESFNLGFRGNS